MWIFDENKVLLNVLLIKYHTHNSIDQPNRYVIDGVGEKIDSHMNSKFIYFNLQKN